MENSTLDFPLKDFVFSQSQLGGIAGVIRTSIRKRLVTLLKEEGLTLGDKKKCDIHLTRSILHHYFSDYKGNINKKVNMFYNFKGGTGKTTICYQISTTLVSMGFDVLLIDCDPQAHLTSMFGLPENHEKPTIYDVMINGLDVNRAVIPLYEGLDIIPSSIPLTKIEIPLVQKMQRERILKKSIEGLFKKYDFIMIDANPAFSLLNLNILMASDQINVVCETQPFSLSGLNQMIEELEKTFDEMNKNLNYCVIPNRFEAKTATAQEVLGALRRDYREETTQTVVRKCEDLNISTKKRLPALYFSNKNSSACEDILDLTREFLHLTSASKTVHQAA